MEKIQLILETDEMINFPENLWFDFLQMVCKTIEIFTIFKDNMVQNTRKMIHKLILPRFGSIEGCK